MSKSVTIPMSDHPLRVCVNGVWYEYKAGATVTVPDEVAAVIEQYIGAVPKPAEEPGTNGQVWTRTDDGADWKDPPDGLPEIVPYSDHDKVLTVGDDDKPKWGDFGYGTYPILAVLDLPNVRLSRTYEEIYSAMSQRIPFITFEGRNFLLVTDHYSDSYGYHVTAIGTLNSDHELQAYTFTATTSDGYPSMSVT